jgi:hypothetical protein
VLRWPRRRRSSRISPWAVSRAWRNWWISLRGSVALSECRQTSCGGAVLYLDGERKFGEGRWKSVPRIDVHAEFVVTSAEVLDEGVSSTDYSH